MWVDYCGVWGGGAGGKEYVAPLQNYWGDGGLTPLFLRLCSYIIILMIHSLEELDDGPPYHELHCLQIQLFLSLVITHESVKNTHTKKKQENRSPE